ncbi:hypothetical protein BDI4_920005 [Burkholderia diffusa]|nr:hypothetical protein BDI4_920005 [Burkholderia diffusa]
MRERLSRFSQEIVFIIALSTGTGSNYHGGRGGHARRDVARAYRTRAFPYAAAAGLACRRISLPHTLLA